MSRIVSETSAPAATVTTTVKRTATRITIDNDPIGGLALVIEYSDVTTQTTTPSGGTPTVEISAIDPVEAIRVPGARLQSLSCFAATRADLSILADQVSAEKWPTL